MLCLLHIIRIIMIENKTFLPNHIPERNKVPSLFRIGNRELTEEVIAGGTRFLRWMPNGHEALGALAGWGRLQRGHSDSAGFDFIIVPEGTRSSSTVLGGLEAWDGEKAETLDFISKYVRATIGRYGSVDTSVTLDTVAVTKDRYTFATPPHTPETGTSARLNWLTKITNDLELVLVTDPNRDILIDSFRENTGI